MALIAGGLRCLPAAETVPAAIPPAGTGATGPGDTRHLILASQFRHRFQHRCPPPVMARIAPDEQHIDRPVLASLRMAQTPDRRRERNIRSGIPARPSPREWTENCRPRDHSRRMIHSRNGAACQAMASFTQPGRRLDEVRLPAGRIEIVEYVRAVLFDLRLQDFVRASARELKPCSRAQTL